MTFLISHKLGFGDPPLNSHGPLAYLYLSIYYNPTEINFTFLFSHATLSSSFNHGLKRLLAKRLEKGEPSTNRIPGTET